jgi:predicted RND superfamily exporter protein
MSSPDSDTPRIGKKQRLLLRIESLSRKNYRVVFLVAALAVLAASWLGSRLELESDVLQLFPKDNRNITAFREALEDFGSVDYLIVLLKAGEEDGPDELEDFADLFAERLEASEELIERVEYRFRLDAEFLELFYENALLFLTPDQLPELEQKLSDAAIRQQVADNRRSLASPAAGFTGDLMVSDPLDLMPFFVNRLAGNRGAFQVDLSDGYYLAKDGRSLLMLVKPTGRSQDLEFDDRLMAFVEEARQATVDELQEELDLYEEGETVGVTAHYTGNYAIAIDEKALIKQDVSWNLFASLFAVSALYWLCYRRFAALLYSVIPLLIGQALTFGVAFYALGGLNASSSAFTALLMGLGTDFTIVMYARYVEERQKGKNLIQATEAMVGETGLGVFTGAITSAGTFFAMCISRFRGLYDLGFLIGAGILLCAVAIIFLLPAMITWNESVRRRRVDPVKKLHLQSFGLEHLITFSVRRRWLVITVVTLMTLGAGWMALQLEFDDSVKSLRSNRSQAYVVQQEIGEIYGASLSYMMAVADADSQDEAIELADKVQKRLEPYVESGVVGSYDSVLSYLPPQAQQQEIIEAIQAGADGAYDPERIRGTFVSALEANGFVVDEFEDYLGHMQEFLSPERPLTLADLEDRGLQRLLDRYVRSDESGSRVVTYIYTKDRRWKRQAPPGLIEDVTADDAGIVVTGTNVVSRELREVFNKDAPQGVAVGLVIVLVLLLLDFRSVKMTMIAMAQLVSGVIMMLGAMKCVGLIWPNSAVGSLNYANAFVATMILGVGIDYSIHLVHRMNWTQGRVEPGLLETGKAVVLAALTNIAGFGTLALGNYPALRSFGLVALFGSLTCLFTSLTLVPALMAKRR